MQVQNFLSTRHSGDARSLGRRFRSRWPFLLRFDLPLTSAVCVCYACRAYVKWVSSPGGGCAGQARSSIRGNLRVHQWYVRRGEATVIFTDEGVLLVDTLPFPQ